ERPAGRRSAALAVGRRLGRGTGATPPDRTADHRAARPVRGADRRHGAQPGRGRQHRVGARERPGGRHPGHPGRRADARDADGRHRPVRGERDDRGGVRDRGERQRRRGAGGGAGPRGRPAGRPRQRGRCGRLPGAAVDHDARHGRRDRRRPDRLQPAGRERHAARAGRGPRPRLGQLPRRHDPVQPAALGPARGPDPLRAAGQRLRPHAVRRRRQRARLPARGRPRVAGAADGLRALRVPERRGRAAPPRLHERRGPRARQQLPAAVRGGRGDRRHVDLRRRGRLRRDDRGRLDPDGARQPADAARRRGGDPPGPLRDHHPGPRLGLHARVGRDRRPL
ncbi:MAG: Ribose ABC transport system, permease protein RbsC, partial [uncultured Thermoleophilia bacterium]